MTTLLAVGKVGESPSYPVDHTPFIHLFIDISVSYVDLTNKTLTYISHHTFVGCDFNSKCQVYMHF